jgi:hypothetical protein
MILIKKIIINLITLVSFILVIGGVTAHASSGASFSVQPKIPDIQKNNLGYFDLELASKQDQVIQVEVFNDSEEQLEIVVEINTATTSDIGNITYHPTSNLDNSIVHNIEDLITSEDKTLILPPKESKIVSFNITMPEEEFEGILLGGLRFTLADEDKEVVGIENRFAYTVGVVLSNSSKELPVNLNLLDITAGQLNYRNHILVNLQNNISRIIDQMDIQAEVYPRGEKNILYKSESSGLRMAPNSNFNYGISTNETAFRPGEYTLKLVATADGEEFEWTQDFEISGDQADNYNKEAILIEEPNNNIWMWVSFVAIAISTALGFLYFKKQRKS